MIATVLDVLAANRTAFRRGRNLRAGARGRARPAPSAPVRREPAVLRWIALAGLLLGLGGAAVLAFHARALGAAADPGNGPDMLEPLRAAFPGVAFSVPGDPAVAATQYPGGALLVASSMQGDEPLRIDLCTQTLDQGRGRLLPLRIGLPFTEVAQLAQRNAASRSPATLRNIVMADPGSAVPHIEITGTASPDFGVPLALNWHGGSQGTRWIGDAGRGALVTGAQGSAAFARQGWFVLGERETLHVLRRTNPACPAAGELVLQLYHPAPAAGGFVAGFPAAGEPVTLRLPLGRYSVPASAPAGLEDRALFNELQGHGLLRLGSGGLAELAPPDLTAWRASAPLLRAAALRDWAGPPLDADARQLLDRLYRKADGDFLREQVRIFNSERSLLAWRVNALPQGAMWQVASGGAQLPVSNSMPPGAARLFRRLPQGWGAWTSVAAATTGASTLRLVLPRPASSGEVLGMMVAGHTDAVRGASVRAREDACDGRGCPSAGAVQRLVLQMEPGARTVELSVQPIDAAGLSDPRYRHLAMERGKLVWREPVQGAAAASFPVARVSLADRNGAALWEEGHPTEQARAAGLASLVGIQPGQANSVAGMLARLPAAAGAHSARLTLDLPLQLAAQAILDCVGMRRGAWNGRACSDGGAAPPGRQAGLVVLDTETGDILAAAGAGMGEVNGSNWAEVRDFDVANPAESPLRLPAFQHDGGTQRSPGSTFKIISALGLEQAAQRDRLLDAVLSGMPFTALDAAAQSRGFAFRSEATTYPADTPMAHVTNFHAEPADRYGQDGRFGLVQAMTYSVNTWFAWMSEMSDRTLLGSPTGGVPDVLSLDRMELRAQRPILDMANRLGFGQAQRLDGGLLPAGFRWRTWDALEATPAHIDPIHSRHELRQMAIGMRMQATPLQMALAAGAVGQGRVVNPRLLAQLDGTRAQAAGGPGLGVRLDRIRAGMKGVVDRGTAASAFRSREFDRLRPGLYGKTGTAPTGELDPAGRELSTVWFAGWLEPGSLPGQPHRLAFAVFATRSEATGGAHVAPVMAALLRSMAQARPAH